MRSHFRVSVVVGVLVAFALVLFGEIKQAHALPSFSRKYQTSCLTCHTVYPMLNSFGEAFRRDGYRFPSIKGSLDSDAIRGSEIALGQEEYIKLFPESVFPAKIMEAVPLSIMLNGAVTANFPDSDAKAAAGNVFTWNGIVGEAHIFAGGAFNDTLTYFAQLTLSSEEGVDIETGYLLWNDIVGPRHMVNLWLGRLMAPQLTSFALHSSYLADSMLPAISIAGLYNPTGSFAVGQPHADGIELNGVIGHRLGYSVGWLASSQAAGLGTIDAEDVYAHLGVKTGGVALDGEGKYGPNPYDAKRPWAEKSLTLDLFAYHGMNQLDTGTGTVDDPKAPAGQRDSVGVLGGAVRAQYESAILTSGLKFEHHDAPYQGTPATVDPTSGVITPGTPNATSHGDAWVQYNELDYVVFPWLVPGVRTELTTMSLDSTLGNGSRATLFRLIPGVATLIRPNIRLILTADFEWAQGVPAAGGWDAAGGAIVAPGPDQASKIEAETITATMNMAF
ncbi:MAG TPA: hypothetical protein VLM85_29310 [Polyangiaceae bacterium]|nr:hypothetical protein [Polyangiaceae bacterium]